MAVISGKRIPQTQQSQTKVGYAATVYSNMSHKRFGYLLAFLIAAFVVIMYAAASVSSSHRSLGLDNNTELASDSAPVANEPEPALDNTTPESTQQNNSVTQVTATKSGSSNVEVVVNGEKVDVPKNGSVSKSVESPNGVNIDVNVNNQGSQQTGSTIVTSTSFNGNSNSFVHSNSNVYMFNSGGN